MHWNDPFMLAEGVGKLRSVYVWAHLNIQTLWEGNGNLSPKTSLLQFSGYMLLIIGVFQNSNMLFV